MTVSDPFLNIDAWWEAMGIAPPPVPPALSAVEPCGQALGALVRVYHDIYVHAPAGDYRLHPAPRAEQYKLHPPPREEGPRQVFPVDWCVICTFPVNSSPQTQQEVDEFVSCRSWDRDPSTALTSLSSEWVESLMAARAPRQEMGATPVPDFIASLVRRLPSDALARWRALHTNATLAASVPPPFPAARPGRL